MSSTPAGRSGRRRGTTQTREAIALAAQTQFAELGYDRATFRSIATAAGVDPALVVHFFGSKEQLFHEVMQLPPGVAELWRRLAQVPRAEVGPAARRGRSSAGSRTRHAADHRRADPLCQPAPGRRPSWCARPSPATSRG